MIEAVDVLEETETRPAPRFHSSLPGPPGVVPFWVCIGFLVRVSNMEPKKKLRWNASIRLFFVFPESPSTQYLRLRVVNHHAFHGV